MGKYLDSKLLYCNGMKLRISWFCQIGLDCWAKV